MRWKFWQKDQTPDSDMPVILPPPGSLPRPVFRHLVDELELGPDWVRSLGCVICPIAGEKDLQAFRAFSPAQMATQGIEVGDFSTLDEYRQLILFSGTYNSATGTVTLLPEIKRQAAWDRRPRSAKSTTVECH